MNNDILLWQPLSLQNFDKTIEQIYDTTKYNINWNI